GQAEQEIGVRIAGELVGESVGSENAALDREVAVHEPAHYFAAELQGVPSANPGQVVGNLGVAVVDGVEQGFADAAQARNVDEGQSIQIAARRQARDADLVEQSLTFQRIVGIADQNHDA